MCLFILFHTPQAEHKEAESLLEGARENVMIREEDSRQAQARVVEVDNAMILLRSRMASLEVQRVQDEEHQASNRRCLVESQERLTELQHDMDRAKQMYVETVHVRNQEIQASRRQLEERKHEADVSIDNVKQQMKDHRASSLPNQVCG